MTTTYLCRDSLQNNVFDAQNIEVKNEHDCFFDDDLALRIIGKI